MNSPSLTRSSLLSAPVPWRPAAVTAVLFALLSGVAARAESPLVLTLDQGVELALEHNHELLKSRQERDRADASIAEARSAAYPGVALDLLYNHTWIQPEATITVAGEDEDGNPAKQTQVVTFGQPNYLSAGLSLQQTIYAGGKVRHALRAAEVYADQTRAGTRAMEQGIAYQVQRIFLGTIMAREAIEVAQLALKQAQAHQEQVAQRFAEGNASEFDQIRAQVEVANLQPPLIEARNAYNRAMEQLKNAIGLEMSREVEVEVEGDLHAMVDTLTARMSSLLSPAATDSLDFDPDHLVQTTLRQRTEMQILDLQIALLEQQLAIDRGDRRPTLALIGQYQWEWQLPNEFRARDEDLTDSWTTGLALKLPLFDGGRTRAREDRTRIIMRQVETQKNQLADQIFLETRNALLDLQEAREKIQAQRQTVALAERGLSIATVRFQSGMATQLEILDAQLALTAARTQQIHALHDYAVAIVTLSHATGSSIQIIEQ